MYEVVQQIYDGLKGKDTLLTRDKFRGFLLDVQHEPVPGELDLDEYAIWDFRRVWLKVYGADAVAPPKEKDLSKTLANYFINSSHNTYLDGNQLASTSTPQAYKNVRTLRCLAYKLAYVLTNS